jgi:hypothetical protein
VLNEVRSLGCTLIPFGSPGKSPSRNSQEHGTALKGEVIMTFKRGMRRLALFLGVLGAIAGGFASYVGLRPLNAQRTRHKKFEQLANLDVVQQQRKLNSWGDQRDEYSTPIPPGAAIGTPATSGPQSAPASQTLRVGDPIPQNAIIGQPNTPTSPPAPPPGYSASDFIPNPFYTPTLNASGIEKVNWAKDNEIQSIETVDGALYFAESAPSAWQYVSIAAFPVLGFFIPWGFISALVWVGTGFFDSSKNSNQPS